MANILKQRRLKPYQYNGKTTFNLRGKSGVYLIYKGNTIVYIGYSGTDIYKTLYRHFQKWTDKNQKRVTYQDLKNITVRVVYTATKNHAFRLEKSLIVKYKPADNPTQYEEFTPTKADVKKVNEYFDQNTSPIVHFEGDLPF